MMAKRGPVVVRVLARGFLAAIFAGVCAGIGVKAAASEVDGDVAKLFKLRCLKCHGPIKPKGKLNLSNGRSIARGGASGPVVVPGDLSESVLWERVESDEMPPQPEEPLSRDEKAALRQWIERGARGLAGAATVLRDGPGADHWAFRRLEPPAPPRVQSTRLGRTPVDLFVLRALEDRGLTLAPEADRATLIRRMSFDLTGLPPTPEEVEAFERDFAPDAAERLIERLLASPRYGERTGGLWLDASGYADSNGYFNADTDRPLAYRYRDYVIRAFQGHRPLNQIIVEQFAGDELTSERGPGVSREAVDKLVATHFLRNAQDGTGESDGNPDEVRADKYAVLEGTIQIIGSSLLGLTLQCAKCHDHKFEPVTQREYYQLQAMLFPALNVEHWQKPREREVVAGPWSELGPWQAHERAIDAQIAGLRRLFASVKGDAKKQGEEAIAPLIKQLEEQRWPNPARIAWIGSEHAQPERAPILLRGNPSTPGERVGPGVLAFLTDADNQYQPAQPVSGAGTSGRRLAFARWLTRSRSRPAALLARVLANRIWQQHFGVGLVETSENLGYTGSPPSHPELLEFLAAELMRSDWDPRVLHRLIMTSSVYRQSSAAGTRGARVDPDNRLLWHSPLRRLDAESIRDAMLAISGELDTRVGGPFVRTSRVGSGEVLVEESNPGAHRRSIYLQHRRTQTMSLLETFDTPSIVTTCTRRLPSTIPTQSLCLLNSSFVVDRAASFAERLERETARGEPGQGTTQSAADAFLARAFRLALGRAPGEQELEASRRFLVSQPAHYAALGVKQAERKARADFCQLLLSSNAFLYME